MLKDSFARILSKGARIHIPRLRISIYCVFVNEERFPHILFCANVKHFSFELSILYK